MSGTLMDNETILVIANNDLRKKCASLQAELDAVKAERAVLQADYRRSEEKYEQWAAYRSNAIGRINAANTLLKKAALRLYQERQAALIEINVLKAALNLPNGEYPRRICPTCGKKLPGEKWSAAK